MSKNELSKYSTYKVNKEGYLKVVPVLPKKGVGSRFYIFGVDGVMIKKVLLDDMGRPFADNGKHKDNLSLKYFNESYEAYDLTLEISNN